MYVSALCVCVNNWVCVSIGVCVCLLCGCVSESVWLRQCAVSVSACVSYLGFVVNITVVITCY